MTSNSLIPYQPPRRELTDIKIRRRDEPRFPDDAPRLTPEESRRYPNRRISPEAARLRETRFFIEGGFVAGCAVIAVAALASGFVPWLLPLTLTILMISFAGWMSERFLQVWAWSAVVIVLGVVAFSLDATLQFLSFLNELLCSWMTYRVIAGGILFCLILGFLEWSGVLKGLDQVQAPALDPRGYGRFAIDDFVEKDTYGDADLASKGDLHLALSRKGNEDLRFTPRFFE